MTFKEQMGKDIDSVFKNSDEFAVSALFNGVSVQGQLVEKFYDGQGSGADDFYTLFWCKFDDVKSISRGDIFIVKGITYGVIDYNIDDFEDGIDIFLNEEL